MDIEYSETKSQRNEEERGISFSNAERFEIESAIVVEDNRKDYGEVRYAALGYIDKRLYNLVFTPQRRKNKSNKPSQSKRKRGSTL